MSKELYIYILSIGSTLCSFLYFVIRGKKSFYKSENFLRFIPIISVATVIISIVLLTNSYENKLETEREKFKTLQSQSTALNDSLLLSNLGRKSMIDSLADLQYQLKIMLERIGKQEKIVANTNEFKNDIKGKISETRKEIESLQGYNEILDRSPSLRAKGMMMSGNTSNFIFNCPTDLSKEYLSLSLYFQDNLLVDKIAYLMISIAEVESDNRLSHLFEQTYKPKQGENKFLIKNYFKKGKARLDIGYILKTEVGKEYPRFEKITCNF